MYASWVGRLGNRSTCTCHLAWKVKVQFICIFFATDKIRQDWAKNGKIWVDRDCFFSCWDKIWRWLDLGSLLGMLMKHDLVKDEEDFFLINNPHKSPREKADNLLQKIVANSGDVGYYLLYVCIRDDTGNPLGHADAVRELVAYGRHDAMWTCVQTAWCILAHTSYLIHVSLTWKREDCENLIVLAEGNAIIVTFVEERELV